MIRIALCCLMLMGCATTPVSTPKSSLPPPPVLSDAARKDSQKAYLELVEHYRTLREFAKNQIAQPRPLVCSVKIGDLTIPMIGLGDIHLVIFSYCRDADGR